MTMPAICPLFFVAGDAHDGVNKDESENNLDQD